VRSINWKSKPKELLRKVAEEKAMDALLDGTFNAPVRVTAQEFKRLAKLHAAAGKKPGRCSWHEVLLREKGKRNEYRCAVCKQLFTVRSEP
jgi:hypothetical protein